ncbi:MAG: hypothetical protein LBQ80_00870 [Clostridium sp.]|jgi:succinate dehydrogenase/fumarate reductase cytochrome b subunit|nr:hypothetical protein [Clostridium sp.]
MRGIAKVIGKILRFIARILGKIIYYLLPKSVRVRLVTRRSAKKKARPSTASRIRGMRRKTIAWIVFLFMLPFILLFSLPDADTVSNGSSSESSEAATEGYIVFIIVAVLSSILLFYLNLLRKAFWRLGAYKRCERYAAGLWFKQEGSLEELARWLHAHKNQKHLGAPSYLSALPPEEICTRRNRPPKPLSGFALKWQTRKVKNTLLFFLKRHLFPDTYLNLKLNHIGNLRRDAEREGQKASIVKKSSFVSVVCVDCGKDMIVEDGKFGRCDCGAPLCERICDAGCSAHGASLSGSCLCCPQRICR